MEGIHKRISQLITKVKVTPSALSKDIGIQRSTLSHIINGRNKPSLDLIQKLKNRYPQLSLDWLVMGLGEMFPIKPTLPQQEIDLNTTPEPIEIPKEDAPKPLPTPPVEMPIQAPERNSNSTSSPDLIVLKPDGTYLSYSVKA